MRILMILIPDDSVAGGKSEPAVRLERAAGPYYVFRDAGAEVVLASPGGGSPLLESANGGELAERFRGDRTAIDEFSDTLRLDQVCTGDFDGAFCVGFSGSIWRAEPNDSAGALIAGLLNAGKPVAVMPSGVDLTPKGVGEGLLIFGDSSASPIPAALALMGAIGRSHINPERNAP